MPGRHALSVLTAVLAAATLVTACATTTGSGTAPASSEAATPTVPPGGIDPATVFTPLVSSTLTTPAPVPGTDGRTHLAYELVLTNATAANVRIDSVDVLDAGDQAVLLSLSGPQLTANSNLLGGSTGDEGTAPAATGTTVPGAATAVVWIDVALTSAVPAGLVHRVSATILMPGREVPVKALVSRIATGTTAPVVLGPPLPPGRWYASEGCCSDDTHHRRGLAPVNGELMVAQRFAIDWYLLDDQNRTFTGDPTKLTSYLTYDLPVMAAADGVVVDSLDGLAETTSIPNPPPIPPITDTVGNHVTVMVAPGVYLLYAHLKPGTVAVQRGQQVTRGDVLGHVGSSGNSTTPHLHFQVMTQPTFFPTDSTPYVFDCVQLEGQVTERIWDDNLGLQPTNVLPVAAATDTARQERRMPLDRNILRFC